MSALSKPVQVFGEAQIKEPQKASQSQTRQNIIQNAQLDGFAKVMQDSMEQKGGGIVSSPAALKNASLNNGLTPSAQNDDPAGHLLRGGKASSFGGGINGPDLLALQQAGLDLHPDAMASLQNLTSIQNASQVTGHMPRIFNSLDASRPGGMASAELSIRTNSHKNPLAQTRAAKPSSPFSFNNLIGSLSSQFESGSDGIAAVGYDRTGGTSYGKYQIASKTGTMSSFIAFAKENSPEIGNRLEAAGPANTGSKSGKMPEVWINIAKEQPEEFAKLQQEFISSSHYTPAIDKIESSSGMGDKDLGSALREVVFSTAVQHGPTGAARIITKAVNNVGLDKIQSADEKVATTASENLVREIYALRGEQFGSSTAQVRSSVQNRLNEEMGMALAMIKSNGLA